MENINRNNNTIFKKCIDGLVQRQSVSGLSLCFRGASVLAIKVTAKHDSVKLRGQINVTFKGYERGHVHDSVIAKHEGIN